MNKYNHIHSCIFAGTLLMLSMSASGQNNFIEGSISTAGGDVIHGLIDYKNWDKNPNRIEFRIQESGKSTFYTPVELERFNVGDEVYLSGIVETEVSARATNDLGRDTDFYLEKDTVFLQAIVLGNKSLYQYKDEHGRENLYIGADTDFELLRYKRYIRDTKGKRIISEQNVYVSQLSGYLAECKSIHLELKDVKYQQTSLRSVFDRYYDCVNTHPEYRKQKEKVRVEVGVVAGITYSDLEFRNDNNFAELSDIDFGPSTDIAGGLVVDVIFPRTQDKWAVSNELLYTGYTFFNREEVFANPESYTITETTFDYTYIKLHTMVRFGRPFGPVFLSGKAGMSNGVAIKDENYIYVIKQTPFQMNESNDPALEENERRTYEQGYILGLEARIKLFSLDLRFEKGNGMSDVTTLKSSSTRFYVMLGYRI